MFNLLINAAVSSDSKETYINSIKQFNPVYQMEIADRIKTAQEYLTDTSVPEVTYGNCKSIEEDYENLVQNLLEVTSTRDQSRRQLNETLQERDQIAQNSNSGSNSVNGATPSPTKQNTYTELAEAKQRIRMLRQEIADKEELAELSHNEMEIARQREMELKEEIQKTRTQLQKARADQDEIDELRTKADQLARAQQESSRLRERLSDFDFFKARVDELQKENASLYDARAGLETEIAANRIRLSGMSDQAEHNDRLRSQVQDLEEQNLELHQMVNQLQDELKRIKTEQSMNLEDSANESILVFESFGNEVNGAHIPENMRLKNEIQRMTTLNTAMLEQQNQHRCAVG